MKIFFFTFLLLSINIGYSQYQSVEVIYSCYPRESASTSKLKTSLYKDEIKKIYSAVKTLQFRLTSNSKESLFSVDNEMSIDKTELSTKLALNITRGNNLIYTNIDQNLILEQTNAFGKNFLIKSNLDDIKWNLTK